MVHQYLGVNCTDFLRPILTYDGLGVANRSVIKKRHVIISTKGYELGATEAELPRQVEGEGPEPGMRPCAICVCHIATILH